MDGLFEWLWAKLSAAWQTFADWLLAALQDVAVWVSRQVLEALAAIIEALPGPDFSVLGSLPGGIVWLADSVALGEGIVIVAGAYLIRFAIRRLPFVG